MTTKPMERQLQLHNDDVAQSLPYSLPLELTVKDREVIRALCEFPDEDARHEFALRALRIGVLALEQAQGQIDAGTVRQEGDRLLANVESALQQHQHLLNERMTRQLQEYFDPQNGRFHERVERLIRRDGELEQLLRRNIGTEDSELCRTLISHVGEESPLVRLLEPGDGNGLLMELRTVVEDRLRDQREHVLQQFSLDNKEGALCRFLLEVKEHYADVSGDLTEKIEKVVGEFSLDEENSALSRLVGNVKSAQDTITREFSLDEEKSALSRLRSELVKLLEQQSKTNQEFQEEVKLAIRELQARKAEADRSTRHGHTFEEELALFIEREAQKSGDVSEFTGNTTGLIKNCKVGDVVLELGPESAAPGARIVFEAKKKSQYALKNALQESETARKNRGAQVGLFVFSRASGPADLEPLARFGNDVVVVWDHEDPAHDLYLRVALTLARALCVRDERRTAADSVNLEQIDRAILEIEKRAGQLDEIKSGAESIMKAAEKILNRQNLIRQALDREVDTLRDRTTTLRTALSNAEPPL